MQKMQSSINQMFLHKFALLIVIANTLFACGSLSHYPNSIFIDSLGTIPVESITWSPTDVDQVLITSSDLHHRDNQIFILNTKTLERTIIEKTTRGTLMEIGWSPDGNNVLFMSNSGIVGDEGVIYIVKADGSDKKILRENSIDASWAPDGKTIAYFSAGKEIDTNLQQINLYFLDFYTGEDHAVLTLESTSVFGLSWSPSGREIVFASGNLQSRNLFIFDVETGAIIQIAENVLVSSPVWSPQGNIIAFHKYSDDGLSSSISLIRSDGKCETDLPDLDNVSSPTWLPNDMHLGFIGTNGIYILEIEKVLGRDVYQELCE